MKLFKILISVLVFYFLCDWVNGISLENVVTMALQETKPRSCVFWKKLSLDNDKKTKYFNIRQSEVVLSSVVRRVPTTVIDLNQAPSFVYFNRSDLLKNNVIYEYNVNISAPLHVFYFDDKIKNFNSSLIDVLELISESVMYMSTPKFLFVLYQRKESFFLIRDILTIARQLQFVDFTVLQAPRNKYPRIFYYNVSSKSIEGRNNISLDLKMFPDKLKNMNGYEMRVGVYKRYWPTAYKEYQGHPFFLISMIQLYKVCISNSHKYLV